ncbi:MAG: hypothetical protein HAW66_03765 [Shewanella sp.]|nr:hypothetical protein [Shewanella sp.]
MASPAQNVGMAPPPYSKCPTKTENKLGDHGYQSVEPSAPPQYNPFHGQAARDNSSTDTVAEFVKIETKSILSLANDAKKEEVTETLFLDFMQIHAQHLTATSLFGKIKLVAFIDKLGTNSDAHLAKISKDAGVVSIDKCNASNCMKALKSAFKLWKDDSVVGLRELNKAISELPPTYFEGKYYLLTALIKAPDATEQVQQLRTEIEGFHAEKARFNESYSALQSEVEKTRNEEKEIQKATNRIFLNREQKKSKEIEVLKGELAEMKAKQSEFSERNSEQNIRPITSAEITSASSLGKYKYTESEVQFLTNKLTSREQLYFRDWAAKWSEIGTALEIESAKLSIIASSRQGAVNLMLEMLNFRMQSKGLTPQILIDAIATAVGMKSESIEQAVLIKFNEWETKLALRRSQRT